MSNINKRCIKNNQKIKKAVLILMSVLILLFLFPFQVWAEDTVNVSDEELILDEQMQTGQIKDLENQLQKYSSKEIKEIMPEYDPRKILEDVAKGKFEFNLAGILNGILRYLFKEIYLNIGVLIKLIIIAIFCAVLKNLQASFMSESVGEMAFYACYIVIVSILVVSFNTVLNLGKEIIDSMVAFMHITIPVLVTLMISSGNFTSGGVLQPVLIMIVEITATLMKNIFIPLIFISTVLSVVNNISDKVQISKLGGFIRQITTWGLSIILTIFIAVVSVQGSLGAVVDGITGKTAKYALSAFIPVVGKLLSDAAEAVVGCTLLIKNAAGIAVMIGVITICLVPLLKIVALIALYRLTCALIEPITEKRIVNCINDMAGSMAYILGIAAAVAFMFLISITAIISASNISVMIR